MAKNPNPIGILKEVGKNCPEKTDKKKHKKVAKKSQKSGEKYGKKSPKKLKKSSRTCKPSIVGIKDVSSYLVARFIQ